MIHAMYQNKALHEKLQRSKQAHTFFYILTSKTAKIKQTETLRNIGK